jgi:hypothetical protein
VGEELVYAKEPPGASHAGETAMTTKEPAAICGNGYHFIAEGQTECACKVAACKRTGGRENEMYWFGFKAGESRATEIAAAELTTLRERLASTEAERERYQQERDAAKDNRDAWVIMATDAQNRAEASHREVAALRAQLAEARRVIAHFEATCGLQAYVTPEAPPR